MSCSPTSAAATSSWVERGLEAQRATWAPPALSVIISTAVSVVTCRQAPSLTPLSGCSLVKRSRTCRSTGMNCSAHSILSLPAGPSARSFTSWSVIETSLSRVQRAAPLRRGRSVTAGRRGAVQEMRGASDPGVVAEVLDPVESLPGELRLAAPEVAVRGGLLVDGTAEIQVLDDAGGGQVEVAADHRFQLRGGILARTVGVHHDGDRIRHH